MWLFTNRSTYNTRIIDLRLFFSQNLLSLVQCTIFIITSWPSLELQFVIKYSIWQCSFVCVFVLYTCYCLCKLNGVCRIVRGLNIKSNPTLCSSSLKMQGVDGNSMIWLLTGFVMLMSYILQSNLDSLQRSFLHCCSFEMLSNEWRKGNKGTTKKLWNKGGHLYLQIYWWTFNP